MHSLKSIVAQVFGSLFILGALGTVLASIFTRNWHVVNIGTSSVTRGLFQVCNSDLNTCTVHKYEDHICEASNLTRLGTNYKLRFETVQRCLYAGCIAAFLTFVASMVSIALTKKSSTGRKISSVSALMFAIVSAVAIGIGLMVFVDTMSSWWNCNHPYCVNIEDCEANYGYSFMYACVGSALALIAFLNIFWYEFCVWCCSVRKAHRVNKSPNRNDSAPDKGEDTFELEKIRNPGDNEFAARKGQTVARSKAQDSHFNVDSDFEDFEAPAEIAKNPLGREKRTFNPEKETRPPPEARGCDDWVFDDESNLYWSTLCQLFYDTDSKQFYDPRTEKWYDPTRRIWYEL